MFFFQNILQLHDLKTGELKKKFPLDICNIDYISGDRISTEIFFKVITFLSPGIIYRCDLSKPCFEIEVGTYPFFLQPLHSTIQIFTDGKMGSKSENLLKMTFLGKNIHT